MRIGVKRVAHYRADLAEIARRHSCAMALGGFFHHKTPDGETMAHRLRDTGKPYESVGENIARVEGPDPATRVAATC